VFKALRVLVNLAAAHNESANRIHQHNPSNMVSVAKHSIHFYSEKNTWLNRLVIHFLQYVMDDFFMNKVVKECDFIGINFYLSMCVKGIFVHSPRVQTSDLNWAMQPSDLTNVLVRFHEKYQKPIMVTENGVADDLDSYRKWWIEASLIAMESALQQGVQLKGYFHWSLIDNFEWAYGKWPHFGLAAVDAVTKERTLRPSARWFSEEISKHRS
jgi:beta-glucosidase